MNFEQKYSVSSCLPLATNNVFSKLKFSFLFLCIKNITIIRCILVKLFYLVICHMPATMKQNKINKQKKDHRKSQINIKLRWIKAPVELIPFSVQLTRNVVERTDSGLHAHINTVANLSPVIILV